MGITEQIKDIELASRRAWPALEESESSLALLRYARGVSRRANSLTPLSPQADAMAGLVLLGQGTARHNSCGEFYDSSTKYAVSTGGRGLST